MLRVHQLFVGCAHRLEHRLLLSRCAGQGDPGCERDLYDLCRHVSPKWRPRSSPKQCFDCLHEHERELRDAKCQRHELQEFCGGGDHACESALRTDCPERERQGECDHCVREHEATLLKTCTREDIEGYCGADDDPRCTEALRHECGRLEGKEHICDTCVEGSRAVLIKAGCEPQQERRFCQYRVEDEREAVML